MMWRMQRSNQGWRHAGRLVAFVWLMAFPAQGAENPSTSTDELFTGSILPRIRIEIPPEGMEVLAKYQWRQGGESESRTDVRATVREGDVIYTNVAVHLKGSAGSFRSIDSDKPAFTLNFDKFAPGQRFHGLQKIHLNNSVQDPSYVSEQICRELFAKAGVPAPRAAHAVVGLNDRNPQLYVLVEGWNKQFFKRHFKNAKGNLYDGGAARDITNPLVVETGENVPQRSRLEDLIAAAQETNYTRRLVQLNKVLDVDRFLTFIAMEVLTAHWDGYAMNRNNYRVFHDLDSDRMVFLPHGMDQMFGTWRSTPTSTITPMMKGIVARAVVSVPEGRRRYLERMSFLVTNVFNVGTITNRIEELSMKVRPPLGGSIQELVTQSYSANALAERITQRVQSVREQLTNATTPLKFDAAGVARLSRWRTSRENGNPSFSRTDGGQATLQISASGNMDLGSWRTEAFLEEGEYQFVGKIRTQDLQFNRNITRGGVTLRTSGDRNPRMLTNAVQWTTFTYDLTVSGLADVELVCEFRASAGRAWFDTDSLRLIRKKPGSGK